jgi:hypothetical protein
MIYGSFAGPSHAYPYFCRKDACRRFDLVSAPIGNCSMVTMDRMCQAMFER